MTRVPQSGLSPDTFYATLGRRPEIMRAWQALDEAMMGPGSTLPASLKENVRRALSQDVGCRYCASFGTPTDEPRDVVDSLALTFVRLVTEDHTAIDDSTFTVLGEELTDDQILELCAWICFKYGANMLGALLRLEPSNEEQRASYEGWLAERERPAPAAAP
jgi:alkylhydroperoxidase family enzyme